MEMTMIQKGTPIEDYIHVEDLAKIHLVLLI